MQKKTSAHVFICLFLWSCFDCIVRLRGGFCVWWLWGGGSCVCVKGCVCELAAIALGKLAKAAYKAFSQKQAMVLTLARKAWVPRGVTTLSSNSLDVISQQRRGDEWCVCVKAWVSLSMLRSAETFARREFTRAGDFWDTILLPSTHIRVRGNPLDMASANVSESPARTSGTFMNSSPRSLASSTLELRWMALSFKHVNLWGTMDGEYWVLYWFGKCTWGQVVNSIWSVSLRWR